MKLYLVLFCLFSVAFCQFRLLNPEGRGFYENDAHKAPCGQSPNIVADDAERRVWDHDTIQNIEVMIVGPHGGGVMEDRWTCSLIGRPVNDKGPLFPIRGGLQIEIPDRSGMVYELKVRTPPNRCTGRATFQLIYSTETGGEFFQCQDVLITNSSSDATSISISVFSIVLAFFVALFAF
eukprot:TRINITY_DN56521_c1_g1_i1.p1 TRINITY_DN56521_c1_g1~~TRINITY_DN56521_c1_g1_i1.p1  ORF type:complete len:179 (-),score=47.95 TRINITY_DN56521_c1_g1_i1:24-560(-)